MNLAPKQQPKHPDGLRVMSLGRVSTPGQNLENIEAGYEYAAKAVLENITDAPIQIHYLGEQGSGLLVERKTMLEAYELIESGWPDVVLMEDLSKPYRNPRWSLAFVQDCMDADIRVIAPGDNIDTFDENCEVNLQAAAMRHGLHIPDTRRRVRRTATYSFHRGGMVQRVRYGYRKLTEEEAKARPNHPDGLLMARIPECTPTIMQLRSLVVDHRMIGQPVVDWLHEHDVPTGPYAQAQGWTWSLVSGLLRDPILCGWRRFRTTFYKPIFRTGKHRRQKNTDPEWEHWSELAHMSEEEWQELQRALDELSPRKRPRSGPDHPRYRVARKDSICPQQHATCAICGGFYYPSGYGVLKCKGAWKNAAAPCWNHVQIAGELTRQRLVGLILNRMDRHPGGR